MFSLLILHVLFSLSFVVYYAFAGGYLGGEALIGTADQLYTRTASTFFIQPKIKSEGSSPILNAPVPDLADMTDPNDYGEMFRWMRYIFLNGSHGGQYRRFQGLGLRFMHSWDLEHSFADALPGSFGVARSF